MLMHGKDTVTGGFDRAVGVTPAGEMLVTSAAPSTPAGAQQVQGNVASGAADAGNPVKAGARVSATLGVALPDASRNDLLVSVRGALYVTPAGSTGGIQTFTTPTDAAANTSIGAVVLAYSAVYNGTTWDRSRGYKGVTVVRQNAAPTEQWSAAAPAGGIVNTTAVVLKAAAGAGIQNFMSSLSLTNASATAGEVVILDGAAVIARYYLAANAPMTTVRFNDPLKSTANAALSVRCETTAMAVYANASGHTA